MDAEFALKKRHVLILGFVIQMISILWGFLYYKRLFAEHMLISLDDASADVLKIFLQHIMVNLPVIMLFAAALKMTGSEKLFLCMPPKRMWKILLLLGVISYSALFFYALSISDDKVKAVYTAVFYLLFVSFMEEFLYRGLVPALQKGKLPKALEWILPNIVFSLSHFVMLFVEPSGASGITACALITFFITTIIFGMIMELLKRKSGSLYIPVLIYAVYDFYGEIMLWL